MDADIYVLAKDRSAQTAQRFLNEYLPKRRFSHDQYECYPWDGQEETDVLLETEYALLEYMEQQDNLAVNLAFYPLSRPVFLRVALLYYLNDGGMICCLNVYQDHREEAVLLNDLKHFLDSDFGFITYHAPPPNSIEDFIEWSKA